MERLLDVECQFISAGYNLKQWDLVKNVNHLNSNQEHEVMKSPGTEFLSPIHPSNRYPFSSLVLDSSAKSIAALIVGNHELYISTLIEGTGFKKILLNSPLCLVFIGINDKNIAVGCNKGIFIVDTNIPKVIEFIRLPILDHKSDTVFCIDSSHDLQNPNLIAFATELGLLYYYNCFREKSNPEQICKTEAYSKILNLKFSPHLLTYLITAHSNGDVKIWDLQNTSCIHNFPFTSSYSSANIDFSLFQNDFLFCIGWNDGIINIFDLKLMQKISQFTISDSTITGLLFVQDGINLIVGDSLGQIHIYNINTQKISRAYRLHSSTLKGLALKNPNNFSSNKQSSNISYLPLGTSQSIEEKDIMCHQSYEQNYLTNFNNLQNPITSKISSLKSTKPVQESPLIISPLRMDYSKSMQTNSDQYQEKAQFICTAQTMINDRNIFNQEISEQVFGTTNSFKSTFRDDPVYKFPDDSNKSRPTKSIGLAHDSPFPKVTSNSHSKGENGILKINEPFNDTPLVDAIRNHTRPISNNTNEVDNNCIQSTMEHVSSDIKDFVSEQMINLLGEITRNVTNQQLQITSLHNKLDMLISSIDSINRTISQNPHLL